MKDTKKKTPNQKVRVLYQNLGGRWYAFADVGNDVFVGKVPTQATTKNTDKTNPNTTQETGTKTKKPSKEAA